MLHRSVGPGGFRRCAAGPCPCGRGTPGEVRPRHGAALEDAQRALGRVGGGDPQRIGVLGFSAGGHPAAAASHQHAARSCPLVDAADAVSSRPDFCVLIYPAWLAVREQGEALPPELMVSAATMPPTFLAMAQDDFVRVESVVAYYGALQRAGVAAEMHLYPRGGHGCGLRRTANPVTAWPDRVEEWLRFGGWLQKK